MNNYFTVNTDCFSYQLIRGNRCSCTQDYSHWDSSHKVYKVADTKFPVMMKPANLGLEVALKYIFT